MILTKEELAKSKTATVFGGVTFSVDGITCDGTSGYIDTNLNNEDLINDIEKKRPPLGRSQKKAFLVFFLTVLQI